MRRGAAPKLLFLALIQPFGELPGMHLRFKGVLLVTDTYLSQVRRRPENLTGQNGLSQSGGPLGDL